MSDRYSLVSRARLVFFKLMGGAMMGMSGLFILSGLFTLLFQIFFPGSFPELPPLITIFAIAVAALMSYLGWRLVSAAPEELDPFIGK